MLHSSIEKPSSPSTVAHESSRTATPGLSDTASPSGPMMHHAISRDDFDKLSLGRDSDFRAELEA